MNDQTAQAKRLLDKARANVVVYHPFFASVLLTKPCVPGDVKTISVNRKCHMKYNPQFIAGLTTEQAVFALCHEILHYMSDHFGRGEAFAKARGMETDGKLLHLVNIAGDYWINATLHSSNIGDMPKGALFRDRSDADKTFEELLEELLEQQSSEDGPSGEHDGESGGGTSIGGTGEDLDHSEQLSDAEKEEVNAQRKLDVANAQQTAKAKGALSGALAKFAASVLQSKVPWYEVLERYMARMSKYDVSWKMPKRQYMPRYYVPHIARSPSMGEIVLQIDVSGSISQQEIRAYNGHIKRIVEQCGPSRVHVLYTDTQVLRHDVFDEPEDLEIEFYSGGGGGSHMEAGHAYIAEQGVRPDVFVTLTDGYDSYSTQPEFPVVWCVSNETQTPPYGEIVRFEL